MNNQQFSSLPGAWQLLKEAFKIYKSRFRVFLGITIIPFLVSLLFPLSFIIFYWLRIKNLMFLWFLSLILLMVVLGILMFVVSLWASVSLLYVVKERDQKIGIKESFAKGWHKILSYWWLSILAGFITMGGFLLFVIPGIIFAIWFSLALYILVSEDIKGMNALFRSRQLIKGCWWKVFWRFLLMVLVIAIIVVPIAVIAEMFNLSFLASIINLLIAPFSITFGFLIYENLKQLKGELPFEPPKRKTKIGFILIGIVGAILIPIAILASIVLVSLGGARERANDAGIMADMIQMRAVAEFYFMENNDSYVGFSCTYPKEATNLCDDIDERLGGKPTIYSSKDKYCGYVKLLSGEYYCIDSTGGGRKTAIDPGKSGYCDSITFICP